MLSCVNGGITSVSSLDIHTSYGVNILMFKKILHKIKHKIKNRISKKSSVAASKSHFKNSEEEIYIEPDIEESLSEEKYSDLEITREDLELMWDREKPILIDIREPYEIRQGYLKDSILLPMRFVPQIASSLPQDVDLVVCCAAGIRSYDVAYYLREQGLSRSWSLEGGVASWADRGYVFPSSSSSVQLLQEIQTTRGLALVCKVAEDKNSFSVHFVEEGLVFEEFNSLEQLNIQN